jgi:DNA helicase-2/ATP-dependent DNA helicase PcrA
MLNDRQQAVVNSAAAFKAIIAGAGSGKTHTLTHLIQADIARGVDPKQIVAITFTRNASLELKERLLAMDIPVKEMFAGTIHQFCLQLITKFSHKLQLKPEFDIFMQGDRKDIIEYIIEKYKFKCKITRNGFSGDDHVIKSVMKQYDDLMIQLNAIDIDQVLTHTLTLMDDPEVFEHVTSNHTNFYVDEFQDTNDIQLQCIKSFVPKALTIIGDPDQSIYEWNGAKPEILNHINDHFSEIELHFLVDNYRSTHQIIEASNKLIRHNVNRIDKDLIAHKDGQLVVFDSLNDIDSEIQEVAEIIKSNLGPLSDFAIITRKNAHAMLFVEGLRKHGIEVNPMLSSATVMKQPEIIKIIKLLGAVANPTNSFSMGFIINQYVKNFDAFAHTFADKGVTIQQMIPVDKMTPELNDVINKIVTINQNSMFESTFSIYKQVIDSFGIVKKYMIDGEMVRKERLMDLYQFETIIKKWEKSINRYGGTPSLSAFIRYMVLIDMQENKRKDVDAVDVMTVHGAKGLEYESVFLPCFTDTDFPNERIDDEGKSNIEEERRIAYVAVTRAKTELYISSHNQAKTQWSKMMIRTPSRFVREMGVN